MIRRSQRSGCVVGDVEASTCFSPEREGKCPPSEDALEECPIGPVAATSIVMSTSESACDAVKVPYPELSRECTARLARCRTHL